MKSIWLIILTCSAFEASMAQSSKYSNEFLQIGVGARAMAMGGSTVASSKNIYAGYWNPAALTHCKSKSVALMHAAYFAGIANYDYGAWASPSGKSSAIGIQFIRFGIDGIANTYDLIKNGEIDYSRVSSFNTTDFAALISYAKPITIRGKRALEASLGGNVKFIKRSIGPFAKGSGFGIDLAYHVHNKKKLWDFGVVLRDATSTYNSWRYNFTENQKYILASTNNVIPKQSIEITLPRLFLAYAKTWQKNDWDFLVEANLCTTFDGERNTLIHNKAFSTDPSLGMEIAKHINDVNSFFVRFGCNNYQTYRLNGQQTSSAMPHAGIGLALGPFQIDYALTNLVALSSQSANLYSNIFSLKYDIDKEKTSKQ